MSTHTHISSLPTAPLQSDMERARESWQSPWCFCGNPKKAREHWFCLEHWNCLPGNVRRALMFRKPGWIVYWVMGMRMLGLGSYKPVGTVAHDAQETD